MSIIKKMSWDEENGQILDGDRRYVLIRNDVLMGVFDQLEPAARQVALDSFKESVGVYGLNSVLAYWKEINQDADKLLDSMITISAQLGWGVWSLTSKSGEKIEIEVENSPFAAGSSTQNKSVCYPIIGIMQAMGELIFNKSVEVKENQCVAQDCSYTSCLFTITPLSNTNVST